MTVYKGKIRHVGGATGETQYLCRINGGGKVLYCDELGKKFSIYIEDEEGEMVLDERGDLPQGPTWFNKNSMNRYRANTTAGNYIVFKAYLDAHTFELSVNERDDE